MNKLLIIILILFTASCDDGRDGVGKKENKLSSLSVSVSNPAHKASCVSLASDEHQNPVISWVEIDTVTKTKSFLMAYFDQSTASFALPLKIPIRQSASIHEEGMPKLAIKSDGTIIAVYETSEPAGNNEYAGAVYYTRSFDKGKTWTPPYHLDKDSVAGTSHSFASITRLGDGEVGACWLGNSESGEGGGRPVLFAKTKGSEGFGDAIIIDSVACECCRIAVSSTDDGQVSIVYRDLLPGSVRDISGSVSFDNGSSFSIAKPFSNDEWVIDGCPHNGPSVTGSDGRSYATWFTGGTEHGIYYGMLDKELNILNKIRLSENGRFSQVCLMPGDQPLVVYNDLFMQNDTVCSPIIISRIAGDSIFSLKITEITAKASYPVVEKIDTGKVMVAWRQNDRISYRIVNTQAISPKFGATVSRAENHEQLSRGFAGIVR